MRGDLAAVAGKASVGKDPPHAPQSPPQGPHTTITTINIASIAAGDNFVVDLYLELDDILFPIGSFLGLSLFALLPEKLEADPY